MNCSRSGSSTAEIAFENENFLAFNRNIVHVTESLMRESSVSCDGVIKALLTRRTSSAVKEVNILDVANL